jgi:hypothetical protein
LNVWKNNQSINQSNKKDLRNNLKKEVKFELISNISKQEKMCFCQWEYMTKIWKQIFRSCGNKK